MNLESIDFRDLQPISKASKPSLASDPSAQAPPTCLHELPAARIGKSKAASKRGGVRGDFTKGDGGMGQSHMEFVRFFGG